jgi:LysM repeat protein
MPDSLMEPLEPYEPQTAYEWDEEEEPAPDTSNVLWGRIAFFGIALLLAFFFGRASAPNGIDATDLKTANDKIAALTTENEDLQQRLQAAEAAAPTDETSPSADASPTDQSSPTDTSSAGDTTITGENYDVQRGDTLNTIAEKFYGDTAYGDYLAEVNHIDDPSALTIGMTLIIPDESELPDKSSL